MPTTYAADTVWDAIVTGKFYLLMDHPDAKYSVGGDKVVAMRHRRVEAGAPPAVFGGGGRGGGAGAGAGFMKAIGKKVQEIMQDVAAQPVPAAKSRL